ncbi:MAG: type I DNA topoisomerase [bacterium]
MSKQLLIVESPSKAKIISKYLGGEYDVVASVGHIRELPKSNKSAIDIPGGFIPHYEISAGKEKVVADIRARAKKASAVLLATDPDREGESIAWHLKEALGLKNPKRVVYYEITKEAIKEAIEHPREIDDNLRKAQEARRVLDRLVGYDLSGVIWKKVRYGLSAGRVQSPALRILVQREREIRAFIPVAYYPISADFKNKDGALLQMSCTEEINNKVRAEEITALGEKTIWKVKDIEETELKRTSRPPFTTSTLQQAASSRLGFTPSRTMGIAQKLYEGGHITYMRTDSTNLSALAIAEAQIVIKKEFGDKYAESKTFKSTSKNAQEAHEAVRPTHLSVANAGGNEEEKKLYTLIRARTLASQMADARIARTKIIACANGDEETNSKLPNFTVTGSRVIFDGWLLADPAAVGEDVILPKTEKDEPLKLEKMVWVEKFTEPPSRYSEAGLVKELDKKGIGRPSTYASIIKTLETRQYIEKINKSLKPTDTGEVVISFLEEHFMKYVDYDFTADMENELDEIAAGKAKYIPTIKKFYDPLVSAIAEKIDIEKVTNLGDADPSLVCPKCGASMIIKLARTGKFLSCSKYPECDGALTMEGVSIKTDEPIGVDPETSLPIFTKIGRFGPYVQLGEKTPENKKPRMASIPKEVNPAEVTVEQALVYLSLPRVLGKHPESGKNITASIGRFGPYIVHDGDFRSLKTDDVYKITLERALEILSLPKVVGRRGNFKKKEVEEVPKAE